MGGGTAEVTLDSKPGAARAVGQTDSRWVAAVGPGGQVDAVGCSGDTIRRPLRTGGRTDRQTRARALHP
ncbi:hypothetical protein H920_09702 [Fukomys damarensis]|uniref:Uncharacterized protein n=1 Tax=Fukomys damarensis TaxID=885580 RepID=A0A091DET7_FUKDA|nr:hypothetical protein H920_09702 [Fukomys damarensis]